MNCHSMGFLQDLYIEKRLTPDRAAQVTTHLRSCSACAQRLGAGTRPAPATAVVPETLKARLRAVLNSERKRSRTSPSDAQSEELVHDYPVMATALLYACLAVALHWTGGVPTQSYDAAPGHDEWEGR